MDMAENILSFAAGALFVERKLSPQSKEQAGYVLEEIRSQFIDNLAQTTWLDKSTSDALEEKTKAMSLRIGYPDWMMDVVQLDEKYQTLEIVEGRLFDTFPNVITYVNELENEKYDKKPVNEWPDIPSNANAFYTAEFNEITVQAGILQPPIYSPEFPDPLLYGSLGAVLGHEFTHGFDRRGRRYDKNGNLAEMWTEEASEGFQSNAQCIVDQCSAYSEHDNMPLRGFLTLAENIVDNGGLKLAYRAMKNKARPSSLQLPGLPLTDDQLFFLAFSQLWCGVYKPEYQGLLMNTDGHAMGHLRVKGTLSNFQPFSSAFQCPSNSTMNPEKKYKIW